MSLEKSMEVGLKACPLMDIINNYDRAGRTYTDVTYTEAKTYSHGFTDEPCIPKAGAVAEAGLGRAGVEWSVFEAKAKGPNVKAEAKADLLEASAMARAEVGSASASVGPVGVTVGLGVDTGVSVGPTHAEVKFLGTGFKFGSKLGISLFGNELSVSIW